MCRHVRRGGAHGGRRAPGVCPRSGSVGLHRTRWAPFVGLLLLLLVCGALGGAPPATRLQRGPHGGALGPFWRGEAALLYLRGGAAGSSDDDSRGATDTATGDDDDDDDESSGSAGADAAAYGGGAVEDSYVSRCATQLRGAARRAPDRDRGVACVHGGPRAVSRSRLRAPPDRQSPLGRCQCLPRGPRMRIAAGIGVPPPARAPAQRSPGPRPGPLRGRVSEPGVRAQPGG